MFNENEITRSGRKYATITAGGVELQICGTVPLYLDWYNGWNADDSAIFICSKDLPAGSTVIDVGANIGIMSCSLAVLRPDLKIISIDPVPDNITCLQMNVKNNNISNIQIIHAAVSNVPGKLKVNNNGPWSVILPQGEIDVPAIVLDQFQDINVSFIKIDVEGWEPYVLSGSKKLLSLRKPLVLMEFNTWSLMLAHHDPISFSKSIWSSFDLIEMFFQEKPQGKPQSDIDVVDKNITLHGSVTDILMKPNGLQMPALNQMIFSPAHLSLLKELGE